MTGAGTCTVDGCDRLVRARRLCTRHYNLWRKMNAPACSVDGCTDPVQCRGWCNRHYLLFRAHGTPTPANVKRYVRAVNLPDGRRVCNKCGEAKPAAEFHADARDARGISTRCKVCRLQIEAIRYQRDRGRRQEWSRQYRAANRARIREFDAARYRRSRPKRLELAKHHAHVRRARLHAGVYELGITVTTLRPIHGDNCCYCGRPMDFEAGTLGVYNPRRASIEHLVPISKGGGHTWANTALACLECNIVRGNREL